MLHALLLCCVILSDGGQPAGPTAIDRAAYESASAKAGKTAAAQIQLALWCEAHGMTAERAKHLALAVSLDPLNTVARGLLGLVSFRGNWTRPTEVERDIQSDPAFQTLFREYLDRRVRTPQKPDPQLRLAAWCLENGLNDEAMVHYHTVTRLDPSRDLAWVRLGYKKHRDRWVKPDDLAAEKLEAERQKRADSQWKPRLEKLRESLESTVETRRLKAEKELYQIADPRAVPMIWKLFGNGSEQLQLVAVELLSQIEGPAASFCLAALALEKPSPAVRKQAARALAYRDPRDVIGRLITLIHKPYKYEVKPGVGPGSTGLLMVDGERFDLQRFYRYPDFDLRLMPRVEMTLAPTQFEGSNHTATPKQTAAMFSIASGLQIAAAAERSMFVAAAMEETQERIGQLTRGVYNDANLIEEANAQINETNARLLPLLESLTGQTLPPDPEVWRKWWSEQLGYVYYERDSSSKITLTDTVAVPDVTVPLPNIDVQVHLKHSCFGAGTLVHTLGGLRKIESISAGDRVLAQNTSTGALSFQPVLATHRNGPAETFRITLNGETIVATGIHRFWKAGKGWTMARDLKAGDRLRMLGGIVTIQSVEPGATQIVYNLSVAQSRDFLVGSAGLLVHDYSFVLPVSEPFDRPANLTHKTPE